MQRQYLDTIVYISKPEIVVNQSTTLLTIRNKSALISFRIQQFIPNNGARGGMGTGYAVIFIER